MVPVPSLQPSQVSNDPIMNFLCALYDVITVPYLMINGKAINKVVYYLLDCGATANFISKNLAKVLNLKPVHWLNSSIRGLNRITIITGPLPVVRVNPI